ncbi:MAG: hypothetical protein H6682_02580 [Candidatus Eisenbacteria bacterium]|nr:hypothetical protein [Candidatus Eisenbacteria bacterium]
MRTQVGRFAILGAFVLAQLGTGGSAYADTALLSNLGLLEQLTQGAVDDVLKDLEISKDRPVVLVSSTKHEGNVFVKDRLAQAFSAAGYDVLVSRSSAIQGGGSPDEGGGADEEEGAEDGTGAGDEEGTDEDGKPNGPANNGPRNNGPRGNQPAANDEPKGDAPPASPLELAKELVKGSALQGRDPAVVDVEILEFGIRYSEASRKLMLGPVQFTRVGGVYLKVTEYDSESGFVRDMSTVERHHWDRVAGRERLLAEGASYPFQRPELRAPGLGTYLEPALVVAIVGGLVFLFYENQN